MPFIVSRVNTKIDENQKEKIAKNYVEMLGRILGKSKNYIMIDLEDQSPLLVRGEDEPAAYIELNIYGGSTDGFDELSKEITKLYSDTLGIPPNNIFINFRDVPGFSINGDYY